MHFSSQIPIFADVTNQNSPTAMKKLLSSLFTTATATATVTATAATTTVLTALIALSLTLTACDPESEPVVIDKGATEHYSWTFTDDGTLTFNCDGILSIGYPYQWEEHREDIKTVVLGDGVTTVFISQLLGYLEGVTTLVLGKKIDLSESARINASSLTDIKVVSGNPRYSSVDGVLFSKYKTELLVFPMGRSGEYTIPEGVRAIETSAFSECYYLESVTIPNSVTTIGDGAFHYCFSLTKVTVGTSIVRIGNYAFST